MMSDRDRDRLLTRTERQADIASLPPEWDAPEGTFVEGIHSPEGPFLAFSVEPTCDLCGHEWRRHDPEDGCCDAPGLEPEDGPAPCSCGRDLSWMQRRIASLSREALDA